VNTALSLNTLPSESPEKMVSGPSPLLSAPKSRRGLRLAFVTLYLLIGLAFRLGNIRTAAPAPDEQHWLHRSAIFLERIHLGRWTDSTTHMGHPGIPAALTMAAGQAAAAEWNEAVQAEPYTRLFIDPLSASRLAAVAVSSLIFLVMILFSSDLIGLTAVLLGTMFLALDCQHISLTRIAHIDGVLTLLATSCLFLGFSAERANSLPRKLGAGVLWGLAIATKPTAAALVGVLLIYKVARRIFCGRYEQRLLPILDWSDLWAVIVGHIVLAAIYTKLWDPYNTYITKHRILPPMSDFIFRASERLSDHPLLVGGLFLLAFLSVLALCTSPREGLRYHGKMLILMASFLVLSCWGFPIVAGNLIRFWYWVAGLSHRNHEAYGMVWSVPGLGYPEHWLRRLPSLVIIGLIPALFFLFARFGKISSRREAEQTALLCAFALAPLIWTLPLAVSNKQTIRYVVPMFPVVFLFSAWGFVELWRYLAARKLQTARASTLFGYLPQAFAVGAMSFQGLVALSWSPNYPLYFNSLTGGITAAYNRGYVLGPVGYDKALQYLHAEAQKAADEQRVEVIGDLELMKFAYTRMYPKEQRSLLKFQPFRDGYGANWVLEFPSIGRRQDLHLAANRFEPAFVLREHGAAVYTLFKVLLPDYRNPETLSIANGNQRMGALREFGNEGINAIASPLSAKAGYIHFNQYVRLPAGKFAVDFSSALLPEAAPLLPLAPDEQVMRLELTSACSRVVLGKEFSGYKLQAFRLECQFREETRAQLSVYWFGRIPLRLGNMTVRKLD